jgi:hypothetical protein
MDANKPPAEAHGTVRAEPDRIGWRMIAAAAVGLMLFTAVVMLLMALLLRGMDRRAEKRDDAVVAAAGLQGRQERIPPAPRLQVYAPRHWKEFRAAEMERLTTYGWMDRSTGAVHVPIERAMDLIAVRGVGPLPAAPVALPDQAPTPAAEAKK